ncbi:HNH endonuclease signature motif containing protein [Thiomicrorhabdus sp.]|uniref:HNH endonuclease signature motif containing protein n=1 Tax=Thiomicrorhabdus sp. TaxID=2039724 RepID=UPI003567F9B6
MRINKPYTEAQKQWLKKQYPQLSRVELTKAFNEQFESDRTVKGLVEFCKRNGIKSGRSGCFEKGSKPWNTGTKGVCKPNSGSFKKGGRPDQRAPIGHERIDKKHGYIWKKVEQPNKFRLKHQLVWEEHNGTIPDGMVLWFLDGNRQNCAIDNLELIKKTEQIRRNKLRVNQSPEEIKYTLKLVAKIQVKVAEETKVED